MDTILMNSGKSKNMIRLLLNLADKTSFRIKDSYVALSNLSIYYTWKNIKRSHRTMNLKYQFQHGKKSLSS